ncbi:MAG: PD40 domain-containing protein [Verrucomicrobiae bacterium]|nr:PD40 domain-containing protein [Verrucomicrobiae bacterium]NNJ44127.1 hypothetical protein [Akkermansiaceae bacterium]
MFIPLGHKTSIPALIFISVIHVAYAEPQPVGHDLEAKAQYEVLAQDIQNAARIQQFKQETYHESALIHDHDRDPVDVILRRTQLLLKDISGMPSAPNMAPHSKSLDRLTQQASQTAVSDPQKRYQIFQQAHTLRRTIAFSNPLLNFDKILFIKRQRAKFDHMCDQYYGTHAVPGGGVFVLANPFGNQPETIDLLKKTTVNQGRLKGQKLDGGSYLSPELSYDGKRVFFSYVECTGKRGHRQHLDHANQGHWSRGRCYHLFSFDLDPTAAPTMGGKNLRQLTDGTFNDFDPCLLPNGRLAFISERRGGYLRCGRSCPSYTVYDMHPDGSDIRILSPHENNEWQPSVSHDGMILYTRWDYVDRHGCTAHHPWIMTPDGRNSRAMHGNFSIKAKRADMEMDLRAIPNSQKIVGTAAPHHGQAYGSLIIHDPRIPDDDAMAPVKRLTPEVAFPESQGGEEVYGTPWPLSENYYLCVYDTAMQYTHDKHSGKSNKGNYGIYLLDAFGNKVLLYRDTKMACLSPIPLRARNKPPVIPDMSDRRSKSPPQHGTMAVMNVYDSKLPWPEGTKIKALRIYQILPSSVPSGKPPHETGLRIAEAKDSVNLARKILGTVPVEKDGSAHFTLPALKEVYFQALDQNGLAVQSMRSSTWVQPGERMVCHGCHESKQSTPMPRHGVALALQRPPSTPQADVEGSNPFSYPLLVQPVLDKNCVQCHRDHAEKGAPPLDRKVILSKLGNTPTKVFRSYDSLIHNYAFSSFSDRYRTTPGKFGAHASPLYKLLKDDHHGVKLSKNEMHRITLWLDSMSNFYGVYEKKGGEAQLRNEVAQPTLE